MAACAAARGPAVRLARPACAAADRPPSSAAFDAPLPVDAPPPATRRRPIEAAPVEAAAPSWDVADGSRWRAAAGVGAAHRTLPLPLEPVLPARPAARGRRPPIRLPHRAADPLAPLNAVDIPAPAFDAANQAITGEMPAPPAEVPHLVSPENLPPGATMDPSAAARRRAPTSRYLKDLWHAIQTQDITGKDALLALTQRPLTTPEPEQGLDRSGGPLRSGPAAPRSGCGAPAARAAADRRRAAAVGTARLGRIHPLVGAVGEELVLPHR